MTTIAITVRGASEIVWTVTESDQGSREGTETMKLSRRRKETIDLLEGLLRNSTDVEQPATDLEKTLDGGVKLYGKLLSVVGHELFDLLFIDDLRREVAQALRDLDHQRIDRFRIKLCFTGPSGDWLARLPWEYARTPPEATGFNPKGTFLADAAELILSRQLKLTHWRSFNADWPVRVLLICSSPVLGGESGLAHVEAVRVVEKLRELQRQNVVTLEVLVDPPPPAFRGEDYGAEVTWDAYVRLAASFKPAIVHFIGHGQCAFGKGVLGFSEPNGDVDWVSDDDFTRVANACKQLKLVFLQACDSALPDPYVSFSGVAQTLAASGLPAVIGMQYRVQSSVANDFAVEFYAALLSRREPISFAVQAARNKLSGQRGPHRLAFGLPVLYLNQDAVLGPPREAYAPPAVAPSVDRGDQPRRELRCPRCQTQLEGLEQKVCLTCLLRLHCPEPGCQARYRDPLNGETCHNCMTPLRQVPYSTDAVEAVPTMGAGAAAPARAALAVLRGPDGGT
jgi:hypothetical protein